MKVVFAANPRRRKRKAKKTAAASSRRKAKRARAKRDVKEQKTRARKRRKPAARKRSAEKRTSKTMARRGRKKPATKKPRRKKARTAAQKAATRRMIAANKRGKRGGGRRKKPAAAPARRRRKRAATTAAPTTRRRSSRKGRKHTKWNKIGGYKRSARVQPHRRRTNPGFADIGIALLKVGVGAGVGLLASKGVDKFAPATLAPTTRSGIKVGVGIVGGAAGMFLSEEAGAGFFAACAGQGGIELADRVMTAGPTAPTAQQQLVGRVYDTQLEAVYGPPAFGALASPDAHDMGVDFAEQESAFS